MEAQLYSAAGGLFKTKRTKLKSVTPDHRDRTRPPHRKRRTTQQREARAETAAAAADTVLGARPSSISRDAGSVICTSPDLLLEQLLKALILQLYVYFMIAHTYFTCDHFCKIATDLRLQGFLLRMPQDVDYPRTNETPLGHTRRAGLRVLYFYRPDSGAVRGDPNR